MRNGSAALARLSSRAKKSDVANRTNTCSGISIQSSDHTHADSTTSPGASRPLHFSVCGGQPQPLLSNVNQWSHWLMANYYTSGSCFLDSPLTRLMFSTSTSVRKQSVLLTCCWFAFSKLGAQPAGVPRLVELRSATTARLVFHRTADLERDSTLQKRRWRERRAIAAGAVFRRRLERAAQAERHY